MSLCDTCSGCGDNEASTRGFDPYHLCGECEAALAILQSATLEAAR